MEIPRSLPVLLGAALAIGCATEEEAASWSLDEVIDETVEALSQQTTITRHGTDRCMDVAGGQTGSGTPIVQYRCHNGPNQTFVVHDVANAPGEYEIFWSRAGRCVGVEGASRIDHGLLRLYPCGGGSHMRWRINAMPGGGYELRNVNSGRCVDVGGGTLADSVILQQYGCHAGPNQRWNLMLPMAPLPPPPDFSLSAAGTSGRLEWGQTATHTVSITPSNGFGAAVSLSASGGLPGAQFSANPIRPGQSSTLTSPTRIGATRPGLYSSTIFGTAAGVGSRSTNIGFRVARIAGAFSRIGGFRVTHDTCDAVAATVGGNGRSLNVTFTAPGGRRAYQEMGAGYAFSPDCAIALVVSPVTYLGPQVVFVNLGFSSHVGFGATMTRSVGTEYAFSPDDSLMLMVSRDPIGPQAQQAQLFDMLALRPLNSYSFTGFAGAAELIAGNGNDDRVRLSYTSNRGQETQDWRGIQ